MYAQFADFGVADGKNSRVRFESFDGSATDVIITVPSFWEYSGIYTSSFMFWLFLMIVIEIDPVYSVLLNPRGKDGENDGCLLNDKEEGDKDGINILQQKR